VKRHFVKSCCGSSSIILELDTQVSKSFLIAFRQHGYAVNEMYTKVGVFWIERGGLSASAPFGSSKLSVKCHQSVNCSLLIDHLENTFKIIIAETTPV